MTLTRLTTRGLLIAAMAGALALAGCGRKGGLDAPPSAQGYSGEAIEQPDQEAGVILRQGSSSTLPVVRGPNKRIPLDVLLD